MFELYNTVSELLLYFKLEVNRHKTKLLCNVQLVIAAIELVEVSKDLVFPLTAIGVCRRLITNRAMEMEFKPHQEQVEKYIGGLL